MNFRSHRPHRPHRLLPPVAAALALALVSGVLDVDLASSAPPRSVTVTVTAAAPLGSGRLVPSSYLGLSTEYWTLPLYGRELPLAERVYSLLHVPGSPLILRVGGDSADHSFWVPGRGRLPRWAFALTPRWARMVAGLVRRLGLHLIVDLNLISGSPDTAVRWARAAVHRLPLGSIAGFEIGNEPDIYSHRIWASMTGGRLLGGRRLPPGLTASDYVSELRAYAGRLARIAPGVPLLAPALANPNAHKGWLVALLANRPPSLGLISVHRYPFSACAHDRRLPAFPTVSRLLGRRATQGVVASITPALRMASRAGFPLRVTELNSVSCEGRPGVSNTFASALWAPDVLFALLERGVEGVNIHIRADAINAPFAVNAFGLDARPLLYGLLGFVRALGPDARLFPLRVQLARRIPLDAWAVQWGDRLHLFLINKSHMAARIRLRGVGRGAAGLERLLGPSPHAESGVTLAGQHLNRAGVWVGPLTSEAVPRGPEGYRVAVPRFSAALLSVPLAPSSATAATGSR